MAKSGSNVVKIEVDDSGGVARDLSQFIEEDVMLNIEALLEESHGFGASWVEHTFTGVKQPQDVTLSGWYDDAATTSPVAVFEGGEGSTREVTVEWKSGKKSRFDAVIQSFSRTASRGALTKFSAVMRPTGAVTEDPA